MRLLQRTISQLLLTIRNMELRKLALFFLMPIVFLLLFIGWSLYYTGARRNFIEPSTRSMVSEPDLTALMSEEKYVSH